MPSTRVTTLSLVTIDDLQSWLCGRGKADNTIKGYTTDLKMFLKWAGVPEVPISMLERSGQTWLNEHRKIVSPSTTGRRLSSLRTFCSWAGDPKILSDYQPPTPSKTVPHPLPEGIDGVLRMIAVARTPEQMALCVLQGLMGLRVSEALSVKLSDFDHSSATLSVRGKGDKTRVVPISKKAWAHLVPRITQLLQLGEQRLVTLSDRGARVTLTTLGDKAGLSRHVSSHDLRATFATAAYDKTLNLRAVQELLGHGSSTTTEIYTGMKLQTMREAADL